MVPLITSLSAPSVRSTVSLLCPITFSRSTNISRPAQSHAITAAMSRVAALSVLLHSLIFASALNLEYLDPVKLQTKTSPTIQQQTAFELISRYIPESKLDVEVDPTYFKNNKDTFSIKTIQGKLRIRASTGVAAVWGLHYYLKKYCKNHLGWQVGRISIPEVLPEVDEFVEANDRFRYYQNVCTASYSFVWWGESDWDDHLEWMAMNGINLALAPFAQEAAWGRIYRKIGMTEEEISKHFTGPAFLSWLRMGNVRGWGGPLLNNWHDIQIALQHRVVDKMYRLGMVPVFPAFSGHVPKAFARIYPNTTFHKVNSWNGFSDRYGSGLFMDPSEPLFKTIGGLFLNQFTTQLGYSHIFTADPFNEVELQSTHWSTALVQETARSIFSTMTRVDENAVWLLQNWMFVHDPVLWPKDRIEAFLTAVPNGRMLVLDLQSEQWPQYELYEMYFGQPFIWCMLHNFGGTLGMFGSMEIINSEVYVARTLQNSTMIGIGLTPEGINQNYVVYDLMLESAWRKEPVRDLEAWVGDYSERRYGCNGTREGWKSLLKSVYSFNGLNRVRGKYVVTRRPSFWIKPWAWYSSEDLFDAFENFVFSDNCDRTAFEHDLVDVTRQALQYRAEQLYTKLVVDRHSNSWVFNESIQQFLDSMQDMEAILSTNRDFYLFKFLQSARNFGRRESEKYFYDLNARNQVTLWGPNGEISDYACKQWAELFTYYYIPRWRMFLSAALDAKIKKEVFDERSVQNIVRSRVEEPFLNVEIKYPKISNTKTMAFNLYKKWAIVPNLNDLPRAVITRDMLKSNLKVAYRKKIESEGTEMTPEVVMVSSTTPN